MGLEDVEAFCFPQTLSSHAKFVLICQVLGSCPYGTMLLGMLKQRMPGWGYTFLQDAVNFFSSASSGLSLTATITRDRSQRPPPWLRIRNMVALCPFYPYAIPTNI